MKKVIFPLLAVAGLTAMSFTDVKAETREVKEVSMEQMIDNLEARGKRHFKESICWDFFTKHIYKDISIELEESAKLDDVLAKY